GVDHLYRDYPTVPVEMVNANGAGDAFVAGMAWALLDGRQDWTRALFAGLAAGRLAVATRETVPVEVSPQRLLEELAAVRAAASIPTPQSGEHL
ncbi:MAG: PfkB family carbohydrate kinase, partial [Spirochaeta sp.]|nr:PfkB family carbohydrate kinase [Spirochaeta sp.]